MYLPPSNSSRGEKCLEFVYVIRILVLILHLLDNFMICGDFVINQWPKNCLGYVFTFADSYRARWSDKPNVKCDTVLLPWLSIDHSPVNSHGSIILIDCDIYMLNTCVSTKGASVYSGLCFCLYQALTSDHSILSGSGIHSYTRAYPGLCPH